MKINIYDRQRRIIHNPKDPESTKVPVMPLLVVLDNGIIGEASTIRGAMAVITGNEYFDAEDGIDEWHMRVECARREAMKAIARGINAAVFDSRHGKIKENYAVADDDPDYEEEQGEPVKIHVENDRLFILSLLKIGAIKVLEREDSYLLRPHRNWDEIRQNGGKLQCCKECQHKMEDEKDGLVCGVYDSLINETDGVKCGSYTVQHGDYKEYTGGIYIDLMVEYGIGELIGQEWLIKG